VSKSSAKSIIFEFVETFKFKISTSQP
jgi:hypothetical protein